MLQSGQIGYCLAARKMCIRDSLGYFQGRLRVNAKGFGFIDRDEVSYYVAREHLCLGMDNDLVLARILQGLSHIHI